MLKWILLVPAVRRWFMPVETDSDDSERTCCGMNSPSRGACTRVWGMLPVVVLLFASGVAHAQGLVPDNAESPSPAREAPPTVDSAQGESNEARKLALSAPVEALSSEVDCLKLKGRPRHYRLVRGLGAGMLVAAALLAAASPLTIDGHNAKVAAYMVFGSVPVGVVGISMIVVPKLPALNRNRRQLDELEEKIETLKQERRQLARMRPHEHIRLAPMVERERTGMRLGLFLRAAF